MSEKYITLRQLKRLNKISERERANGLTDEFVNSLPDLKFPIDTGLPIERGWYRTMIYIGRSRDCKPEDMIVGVLDMHHTEYEKLGSIRKSNNDREN